MPTPTGVRSLTSSLVFHMNTYLPRLRKQHLSTTALLLKPETKPITRETLQPFYQQEQISALLDVESGISRTAPLRWKPRRRDSFSLPYFTDLSRVDPFLDSTPSGVPKSGRWPSQPVPKMEDTQFQQGEEHDENKIKDLSRLTGLPILYLQSLKIRELVTHRVTNQTRLGKIAKQYVLTIAGDGNGMIGIGEASSTSGELASRLSQYQAIKNLRPIVRYEDRTIHGNVKVKMGAVEVLLMSRPPGFGVRCSQYIFEICRCAGISDLAARVERSRNPMNVIKATVQALTAQKTPDAIAKGRGKKIVDVRKAYYGRGVY
ncbi:28S ribosomal protein S5, mitochondrial [Orbilia oligospora]|uniref:Small ribosomal subunit protein uS5m n=1 Tax=Orbilia oligospora TaxID=2813651 RepID=A0A7C8PEZ0_ORBOL|nr:28S ribosomal protein S5, mitochondrial [Orbilia oligospora]TGJ71744.1 28S ribosomal protein S5, mitochondrial [Orbilia oligospora]